MPMRLTGKLADQILREAQRRGGNVVRKPEPHQSKKPTGRSGNGKTGGRTIVIKNGVVLETNEFVPCAKGKSYGVGGDRV